MAQIFIISIEHPDNKVIPATVIHEILYRVIGEEATIDVQNSDPWTSV